MDATPASFYGKIDKSNPVISAFDSEIKEFRLYMKGLTVSPSLDQHYYSKGSKKLFEIWNKYQSRLPLYYYEDHLLQIADFLFSFKLYRLALWQGYGRFLQHLTSVQMDSIENVDQLKNSFFSEGFDTERAKLTFRALQGQCLCAFHMERERAGQPDHNEVHRLLNILRFIRVMMEAVLPHERLCWILYNGSLHIYNISRFLMSVGRCAEVLEYLLWACICFETSIPLLTPRFLSWRVTLYCAVCQCYYNGQAGVQAEMFARRALGKVIELGKLVEMTGTPASFDTQHALKGATIKLAVMVFKRSVYEPRRKPKGLFRFKQKNNLKEVQSMPWPRTPTERILMELFEGNAAQFLAILEALWDSSRRPLQTGIPEEPEMQEVTLELMSAGISILSGIGGSSERVQNDSLPPRVSGITPTFTLMEMATAGESRISVNAAVKFLKLLFRYEQWDMLCILSDSLLSVLTKMEGHPFLKAELELQLLNAVECLISTQRVHLATRNSLGDALPDKDNHFGQIVMSDELMALVQILHTSVCEAAQQYAQPDRDLVMDIIFFLWAKCKAVFQRAQTRHWDTVHYLGKMESKDKWVQALYMLTEVAHACRMADTDPVVVAEMTLRLAIALESNAETPVQSEGKAVMSEESSRDCSPVEKCTATLFKRSRAEQLQMVLVVLENGVEAVSHGRAKSLPADGSAISDTIYMQKFGGANTMLPAGGAPRSSGSPCLDVLSMDLHLEMLAFQHRIALKLLDTFPAEQQSVNSKKSHIKNDQMENQEMISDRARAESKILEKIKKNKISKALFLAQKALLSYKKDQNKCTAKTLLKEAVVLMERAEVYEKKLSGSCAPPVIKSVKEKTRPPPAPILLCRTNYCMTFTPASYILENQVCWYSIFGREAEGLSFKVRIGDSQLAGSRHMVPARGDCILHVTGLVPNQTYIFAVAAYDAKGNIVGGAVGESTRPLLASLPLPLLTAWGYLAQVSYQTSQYSLAKRACTELFGHFIISPSPISGVPREPTAADGAEAVVQTRLRQEMLQFSSPVLLQLLLSSIFIDTDIHIQEGRLYCDSLSGSNPLIWAQEARLAECEHLLVALDLALYLNDGNNALQAVVSCYGLLAPLIYYQIKSEAVIQVLMKCLTALQKIPAVFSQKQSTATAGSLQHMVACMAYYVAKGLRSVKESRMASAVLEQGKKLLQEITEVEKPQRRSVTMNEVEPSEQLKALEANIIINKKAGTIVNYEIGVVNRAAVPRSHELTGQENPNFLYLIIETSSLKSAFKDVMKFKRKPVFLEFAVRLLQKALREDQLELVVEWGQDIFSWLSRRDEGMALTKRGQSHDLSGKELKKYTSSVIEYNNERRKLSSARSDKKRRDHLQKKQLAALKAQNSEKEVKAVDTLLHKLSALVSRRQRRQRLRRICSEERLWRCHLNLEMARAHLGQLQRGLETWPGLALQRCYSEMPRVFFSLAQSGTIVKWKNVPQHIRAPELIPPPSKTAQPSRPRATTRKVKRRSQSSGSEESAASDGEIEADVPCKAQANESDLSEQSVVASRGSASQLPCILNKAALHLRRAMVLAHRGGHWTSLQWACRVLWDQTSAIELLVEQSQIKESVVCQLTVDQLYTVVTPLLVLASDLLMDMMQRLQLWKIYDKENEDFEDSVHFSAPLDDGMLVDLHWLRTLVLHTLELLYYQAKWETLAYLAILYNSHTRERYTHIISPLLVHAQRRLQDRIRFFGGPSVPQPHFTHTESLTGQKITCRSYVGMQLLSCWNPSVDTNPSKNNADPEALELAEVKRAMCLVRVPLDVDDTLKCFRETVDKRPYTLQTFEHSRTLLRLLLAHTQSMIVVPFCKESSSVLQGKVEFILTASTEPAIDPPDLSTEDFSSLSALYSSPLSPSHIQTVFSAYNSSIQYLQASNHNSLQVQALHDLGNLHFYNGNRRAAHSYWSKALDCALQYTGVVESWDGVSWGKNSSLQQILRHAGIWGCFQGALLAAKIAQHILTSNINQRTKCCLLSAQLFKCLLGASFPHPQDDFLYSSYCLDTDIIPGVELFSEQDQGSLSCTVSSLAFLCHWLYTSAHFLVALPMLAFYLHVVGTVCRDVRLTVGGRILRVKVLTELGLFSKAIKELNCLTNGEKIPQSYSCYNPLEKQTKRIFFDNKSLMDPENLEALEDVVNKRPSGAVIALYGTRLNRRLLMVRAQLVLAVCTTIQNLPEPLPPGTPDRPIRSSERRISSVPGLPDPNFSDKEDSSSSAPARRAQEAKALKLVNQKDKLTLGKVKTLLLSEASSMLVPQLFLTHSLQTDPEELELAIEARMILSEIRLQQGKIAASADLAVSALRLLQDSHIFHHQSPQAAVPRPPSSVLKQNKTKQEQTGSKQTSSQQVKPAASVQPGNVVQAVEARERMGPLLWLQCRLSVVRSLAAHIPGTAIIPGVDSSLQAARLLREGLQESEAWGDPETQALLLLQGFTLDTHQGRAKEDRISRLQEAVSLLSGRRALSLRSRLALAKATVLLSELGVTGSQSLSVLAQKLLHQQLCALGESLILEERGVVLLPSSPGLRSMYHPQLCLLAKATMHLGCCVALQALSCPSEDKPWKPWVCAQDVLQSALDISQASASRDLQLEADILYCKGVVGRYLISLHDLSPQMVAETLLESISITLSHSHNLQLIRRCYLELALVYVQQWEQSVSAPQKEHSTTPPAQAKQTPARTPEETDQNRCLTEGQTQLLLFWVCLRAATKTTEVVANCAHVFDVISATGGHLPLASLKSLPNFATSDLLTPCGGVEQLVQMSFRPITDWDTVPGSQKQGRLTWVHLSRYYTHLFNLVHMSTWSVGPVEGLMSGPDDCRLLLRLTQLHSFFNSHLPSYKEQSVLPQPPANLILLPQLLQVSPTEMPSVCQAKQPVIDTYPWANADKPQLIIQWHTPLPKDKGPKSNTIALLFGLNAAPLSASYVTASSLAQLQGGQHLVCMDRLKVVQSELNSAYREANVTASSVSTKPTSASPKPEKEHCSKGPDRATASSPQQLLVERTKLCCNVIKNLLKPDSSPHPLTEVPFEPNLQTLRDLKCCFNPAAGGTLEDKALILWMSSLLL